MAAAKKTRTSKSKRDELAGQADPRATLNSAEFLVVAKPLLAKLEADLQARTTGSSAVTAAMRARFDAEKAAQRTADSFAGWSAALATQVAAAWLLSCVFVRTLEDRGLVKQARLAGPGAEDSQKQFFQLAPSLTERDYLLTVFRELERHPAAAALFDAEHSLVWKLSPSAEVAKELLALFRAPSAGEPAFRFGQASTRFLGDLYQDLSEDVRKRYALLQTPDFVETYILDRTLEPAILRFGLDDTTLIDPTCGSGHFLLGAFDRLFEHRLHAQPGIDPRAAAVLALDCVYGADINPYAVAIARFRLTLSFLEKAGYSKLADAPQLPLHLVCADSLRINPQHPQQELWQHAGVAAGDWLGEVFAFDDETAAKNVLGREYAAVVANPPYITVKDAALRDVYRHMYPSCHRSYSLSVPFCERIFQLARPRGYTGQITSNSFMKREFGRVLIEKYLPTVNLDGIVNTSGAYIPGHGTPTVLLFGTHEAPHGTDVVAAMAKRGEPSTPEDPSRGLVWRSIVEHGEQTGYDNDYISVARVGRDALSKHPWSLGGGGASELKELLEERAHVRLEECVDEIGFLCMTRADDVYISSRAVLRRNGIPERYIADSISGEDVRDYSIAAQHAAVFPYESDLQLSVTENENVKRFLWPYRALLWLRREPNGNHKENGLTWWEWSRFQRHRFRRPDSISFAFVATHNHFVFDRGGKVFNRTAPIIKLPEGATEDDHLALVAYLNSSTACFWMKQVFFDKGNQGGEKGRPTEPFEAYFEFDGTKIRELPLPPHFVSAKGELARLARRLGDLASERSRALDISSLLADNARKSNIEVEAQTRTQAAQAAEERIRAVQEDLDWLVYRLFEITSHIPHPFESRLPGARVCDHLWACSARSKDASVRYFGLCHAGNPTLVASDEWSARWNLVADANVVSESSVLSLIETPAYKRTYKDSFGPVDYRSQVGDYIGTRLEDILSALSEPISLSAWIAELRLHAGAALDWFEKLSVSALPQMLNATSIPYLAVHRFSEAGLDKARLWNETWAVQRAEDRGESVVVDVPPKFASVDFMNLEFYRNRGPLDVPRERFISYPGCESDRDGEPVFGWAGWNHLRRAQALASLYLARRDGEGWAAGRLTPMLAGLLELIPWVKQWHDEPSAEFNDLRMGDYYAQFLDGECRSHGLTHDDLRAWRPEKKSRSPKARAKTEPSPGYDVASKPKRARVKKKSPVASNGDTAATEGK